MPLSTVSLATMELSIISWFVRICLQIHWERRVQKGWLPVNQLILLLFCSCKFYLLQRTQSYFFNHFDCDGNKLRMKMVHIKLIYYQSIDTFSAGPVSMCRSHFAWKKHMWNLWFPDLKIKTVLIRVFHTPTTTTVTPTHTVQHSHGVESQCHTSHVNTQIAEK